MKTDSGIWITSFDFLRFAPLTRWVPSLDGRHAGRGDHHGGASGCDHSFGGCYLAFPYYYPIADVLTGNHYLPAPDPLLASEEALPEAISTDAPAGVGSRAAAAGTLPRVAVRMEELSWDAATGKRRVRVAVSGPDHMSLVLRDGHQTQQLPTFSGGTADADDDGGPSGRHAAAAAAAAAAATAAAVAATTNAKNAKNEKDAGARDYPLKRGGASVLTGWSITDGPLPAPRSEGVRLVQLTHGTLPPPANGVGAATAAQPMAQPAWGRRCEYAFTLDIEGRGGGGVALTVVGHYAGHADTKALHALYDELPEWARGAEWAKFASMLVSTAV